MKNVTPILEEQRYTVEVLERVAAAATEGRVLGFALAYVDEGGNSHTVWSAPSQQVVNHTLCAGVSDLFYRVFKIRNENAEDAADEETSK